jgi:hypothetical protein
MSPATSLDETNWGLFLDWLLTASQGDDKKKRSLLAMELYAVNCDDIEIQDLMAERVDKIPIARNHHSPNHRLSLPPNINILNCPSSWWEITME